MKTVKRFLLAGAAIGAAGPILLVPVMIWLELHPRRVSPGMELVFIYAWPTSLMLMAGSGSRFFSPPYLGLLLFSACSNVVLFGTVGLLVGSAYAAMRKICRRLA